MSKMLNVTKCGTIIVSVIFMGVKHGARVFETRRLRTECLDIKGKMWSEAAENWIIKISVSCRPAFLPYIMIMMVKEDG
jgi:hypothetical protein